jgi:hypothetical protein
MKPSDILTLISSVISLLLTLFIVTRVIGSVCFSWFDYLVMFGTLFGNIAISILAAAGR